VGAHALARDAAGGVGGVEECRGRLGGTVGAEGLPLLVAVGASAEAARDLDLAQVSGDSFGWLTVHVTETVEAVTAASLNTVQKRAEQIVHHATS
jgi:hypothetical protein